MTTSVKWATPIAAAAFLLSITGFAMALDGDLKGELNKLFEGGAKQAGDDVGKVLKDRSQSLVDEALKIIEKQTNERIAKLEREIKARDAKIADLEARVKDLADKLAKPAPAPVPVPPAVASNTFLGVGHLEVPQELRAKHKIEGGAFISQVLEDSPAAALGLAVNDVVLEIQGKPITSENLSNVVAGLKPEQEVSVTYLHDGNRVTKSAKLADREKYFAARAAKIQPPPAKKGPIVLGVLVQEKGGLIVESVEEGFTGHAAGIKVGDKLTHLNGKELKLIDDVQAELKKVVDGDKLLLGFSRGEEKFTVSVLGAHGKGAARVLASESVKLKEESKPTDKKPAFLGVAVVQGLQGVVVENVVAESSAASAGFTKGDLIKKLNGKDVPDVAAFKSILGDLKAGEKVSIELVRDGKIVEVKSLDLKADGEKVVAKVEEPKAPKARQKGFLGILATQTITSQIVVKTVNPGGAGEKADLKVGDVILKINDKAVTTFDELALSLSPMFAGDTVTLRIKRGNEEKDLKVTLGEV